MTCGVAPILAGRIRLCCKDFNRIQRLKFEKFTEHRIHVQTGAQCKHKSSAGTCRDSTQLFPDPSHLSNERKQSAMTN